VPAKRDSRGPEREACAHKEALDENAYFYSTTKYKSAKISFLRFDSGSAAPRSHFRLGPHLLEAAASIPLSRTAPDGCDGAWLCSFGLFSQSKIDVCVRTFYAPLVWAMDRSPMLDSRMRRTGDSLAPLVPRLGNSRANRSDSLFKRPTTPPEFWPPSAAPATIGA